MDETGETIELSARKIRAVIEEFLKERLQPKLEEIDKDEGKLSENDTNGLAKLHLKREKAMASYEREAWIADAAKRVEKIVLATHAIKYMHPDAKGSCLYSFGNSKAGELVIGTHTVQEECKPDFVCNSAANLDVCSFLREDVDGCSLLSRVIDNDSAFKSALGDDPEEAQSWTDAFAGITQQKGRPASHKLAKQIYWPLGKGEYHLLAPLFPTSLAHVVWNTIREDRFSEDSKEARTACKAGKPHTQGYREYPNLAVQKYGGTKPQNISQLNSERHGENYLLPSYPPTWVSEVVKPPLHVKSVFEWRFGQRRRVREFIKTLRNFLLNVQNVNNIRIRKKRAELVGAMVDELFSFAAEIQELPSGWSKDNDCRLNLSEQCWLDPGRAQEDEAFATGYRKGDWQDEVCQRFGNWFNARLTDKSLKMGGVEAREWQSILDKELRLMRQEMGTHD
jgi:CRISPR-associated protein Csy1